MSYSEPFGGLLSREQIDGNALVWLLEVRLSGMTLRWSSRPVNITTEGGDVEHFPGGLDSRTFERRLSTFSSTAEAPEASFTDLPPPDGLASQIAGGDALAARPGELSLWVEGTTYERRQIMVWGHTQTPRYGGDREPVAFTLGSRVLEDGELFPPPDVVVESGNFTQVASTQSWGSGDVREGDEGKLYPLIMGQPGGSHTGAKGTAAYVIFVNADGGSRDGLTQGLLIAYGRVASQAVKIYAMDGNKEIGSSLLPVLYDTDDSGNGFSFVDVSGIAGDFAEAPGYLVGWVDAAGGYVEFDPWVQSDVAVNAVDTAGLSATPSPDVREWNVEVDDHTKFSTGDRVEWVDWGSDAAVLLGTVFGKLTTPDRVQIRFDSAIGAGPKATNDDVIRKPVPGAPPAVNTAGEAALLMLRHTGAHVDLGRWQAIRGRANAYRVDMAVREPVSPWEWVRKHLLRDFLPASVVAGPGGFYPVWWLYDATPANAVAHIESAGPTESRGGCCVREGGVEYQAELGDIANFIHLKYRASGLDGTPRKALAVRGFWSTSVTRNRMSTVSARRSHALYKRRRIDKTTQVTADTGTVAQILHWMSVAKGFAHRTVDYACGKEYAFLQLGDPVTLSDSSIGEVDRVALVTGLTLTDGPWMGVQLQLVTNPAVTPMSTGPNPDDGEKEPAT